MSLLAIDHRDALALQRKKDGRLDNIDPERFLVQPALLKLDADFSCHVFGASHFRRHGAAQQRNSRPRTFAKPGAVQLMMAGSGAEIPKNWLVVLRQQREPADFVLRPTADVRRGQITHIVHVKTQQGSHLGFCEKSLSARQTFAAQSIEIDPLFPINGHRSISWQCHDRPPLRS